MQTTIYIDIDIIFFAQKTVLWCVVMDCASVSCATWNTPNPDESISTPYQRLINAYISLTVVPKNYIDIDIIFLPFSFRVLSSHVARFFLFCVQTLASRISAHSFIMNNDFTLTSTILILCFLCKRFKPLSFWSPRCPYLSWRSYFSRV